MMIQADFASSPVPHHVDAAHVSFVGNLLQNRVNGDSGSTCRLRRCVGGCAEIIVIAFT